MLRPLLCGSLALLGAALLSGCVSDEREEQPSADSRLIQFVVGSSDMQTRAATESTLATLQTNGFRVITDWTGSGRNVEYMNTTVTYDSGNSVFKQSGTPYYMPNSGTLNFYGYYSATGYTATHTAGSAPTISVTDVINHQDDLLVAANKGVSSSAAGTIPFTFTHAFAGIWFELDSSNSLPGTLGNISITNMKNSGTYTLGSGWGSLGAATSTYTVAYSSANTAATSLLVIPQSITSSNAVTVEFTPTGGSKVTLPVTNTLSTVSLTAGTRYKFTLKIEKVGVTITSVSMDTWPAGTNPAEFTDKKNV